MPPSNVTLLRGGRLHLSAKFGDIYLTLVSIDVPELHLPDNVARQLFTLDFIGQMSQLKDVPSGSLVATPQASSPVHDENAFTGGNPERTDRTAMVQVTCFFASGQENVCGTSDIFAPPSAQRACGVDGSDSRGAA